MRMLIRPDTGRRWCFVVAATCLLVGAGPDQAWPQAQQGEGISIVTRWLGKGDLPRPDMTGLGTVRFATDTDFPPFNYADEQGRLTGLNIDLARAICDELTIRCIIEPITWKKLQPALEAGKADAVIASIAINKTSRKKLLFTDSYYRTPARFVTRRKSSIKDVDPEGLSGKLIAVGQRTAHEAYLRAFFTSARIRPYPDVSQAREALRTGKVDAYFGDAIQSLFWISGTTSRNCCQFAGGPYTEAKFFGDGVGIAVRKDNRKLARVLNYGLDRLRRRGIYRDLLLRYFPAGSF